MGGSEESKSRWEGETSIEVEGMSAEQVWPLLEDFCSIHKWLPIETCFQVEGTYGQPGLIRYCAMNMNTADDEPTLMWAKEKLLHIDPIQRSLIYEVVDSNMGFNSYVATIQVFPVPKPTTCKIQWSFVCHPMEMFTFEAFFSLIRSFIHSMAKNMELAASSHDKSA
ncbi:lachrymatory-factor synthase [Cajanus cajan]|uniref:Lachrymatory-factor synthase n=1 Tax=Cajanus cajan TaxID=3821 RepID=A0A151RK72_CAJCA|nr:lachrymatory-factor synthase [Cajanus cajan]KYP42960.1 Lachrymatory-factor synthase [Cajanus cajan]